MEFYIPVSQSDIQSSVMHLCDPWPLPSACALQKKWRNWFIWFFSSPLKDNFMLMKNAAKESGIQRSPRSTREGAVFWCLVCNGNGAVDPESPGHPSLCWTKGLCTWTSVCCPCDHTHLWLIQRFRDSFSKHLVPELCIQLLPESIPWPATPALLQLTHQLPRRRQCPPLTAWPQAHG